MDCENATAAPGARPGTQTQNRHPSKISPSRQLSLRALVSQRRRQRVCIERYRPSGYAPPTVRDALCRHRSSSFNTISPRLLDQKDIYSLLIITSGEHYLFQGIVKSDVGSLTIADHNTF